MVEERARTMNIKRLQLYSIYGDKLKHWYEYLGFVCIHTINLAPIVPKIDVMIKTLIL